jgi:hypothetical protein
VREAQEVEGLRLAQSPCRSSLGGEPPELDQPGLVGMQLQPELRQPLAKVVEELLGVALMLEADDEIIGEPHDDHVAACLPTPPLPDPPVEHVVEVDVGEQRRGHAPNAMGNFCFEVTLGYRRLELLPRAERKERHDG